MRFLTESHSIRFFHFSLFPTNFLRHAIAPNFPTPECRVEKCHHACSWEDMESCAERVGGMGRDGAVGEASPPVAGRP